MNTSYTQVLTSTWVRLAKEAGFPVDYDGTLTPGTHRACGVTQEWIRKHIIATNDMRLFGLLHLLGRASLCMGQVLRSDDYTRIIHEVAETLRKAGYPNSESYTQEEVIQAIQERINRRLGKSV